MPAQKPGLSMFASHCTNSWNGQKQAKRHAPPPVALVRRCLSRAAPVFATKLPGESKVPELNPGSFDDAELQQLRTAFGGDHEDWDSSADRPKKLWKAGWSGRVTFCRRIVDLLSEVLTQPVKQADFELLSDFFSIARSHAPQRSLTPDSTCSIPTSLPDIAPKLSWFRLDGRRGGFRIVPTTHEPMPTVAELKVSVAYDVISGNPLKKWKL